MSLRIQPLSHERLLEFKRLYKEHFNMDLSDAEAQEESYRLMSFIAIIIENTPRYRVQDEAVPDQDNLIH